MGKIAVGEITEVVRDEGDAVDLGAVVQIPEVAVTRMALSARRRTSTPDMPDIDTPDVGQRRTGRVTYRNTNRLPTGSPIPDVIPDAPGGRGIRGLFKGGKKALKAAGILGTVAGIGLTGYDLYQASKEDGLRAELSSTGGSRVGGMAGGVVGGIVGTIAGPLGTVLGATAGGWVGDKLGSLADSSGITKSVVDGVVSAAGGIKDAAASIGGWLGITKKKKRKSPRLNLRLNQGHLWQLNARA